MSYTCHSGGALGSDIEWENECNKYGIKTIAYSFYKHNHVSKNPKVLTEDELKEGYQAVLRANKILKRNCEYTSQYVKNLLSRNWFQIKNSEAVFAIINKFMTKDIVSGGTGWAIQMAVDCDKPIFVFLQNTMGGEWFQYMPLVGFEKFNGSVPCLYENFAGIGTREINEHGKSAIKNLLKDNFKI